MLGNGPFEYEDVRRTMTQTREVNTLELAGNANHLQSFLRRFWDDDVSDTYHENSKLTSESLRRYETTRERLDSPGLVFSRYTMDHDYPTAERIELPPPTDLDVDLQTALDTSARRPRPSGGPVTLELLSTLLHHSCGVRDTETRGLSEDASDERTVEAPDLRYPSPDEAYPTEHYLFVDGVEELHDGLYYYAPARHSLRVLDTTADVRASLEAAFPSDRPGDADVVYVASAVFWRTKLLYGPRGYRSALQESGHALQNVQLVARGLGLSSEPLWGFRDDEVNRLLSIDGTNEAAVHALAIGG